MAFPDRRLERPLEPPEARSENIQDVVPVSERNQDLYHSTHELVTEGSRPLTEAERKAADRDTGIAERVFAPASERIPRVVEGYRDVVEHTDTGTPERQAIGQPSATPALTADAEPSFTRVPRPSTNPGADNNSSYPAHGGDWSAQSNRWMSNMSSGSPVPFGIGWLSIGICGSIGVWLWMRWQRERNKPINRLRRQAQQARQRAYALRDQMPDMPEEAVRPAMGVGSALLALVVLLWQQSQRRSRLDEARSQSHELRGRAEKVYQLWRERAAAMR
jgi:hypothetical protein